MGWLSNRYLLLGVAIERIAVITALIYIPWLGNAFNHAQLPARYWFGLCLFAPVLYSLESIRKAISGRLIRTYALIKCVVWGERSFLLWMSSSWAVAVLALQVSQMLSNQGP